ncbi:MAG: M20/M25/M40 family metallo-hydrolase [Candidatus Hodarchaeales archaeon]
MIEINHNETTDLLIKLIQNKCVNPPGNEMKSINTIKSFLKERNIDSQIFESAPNRGNLFAEIKGKDSEKPCLIFGPSHIDVVPVSNPDDWDDEPFSGKIKDGYIYGRGALDMLFIVVTQVQAFAKLVEEDFQPESDLKLLIVADEEAGGLYGVKYVLKQKPDIIKSGDYAVTEAGGVSIAPGKVLFVHGEKGGAWKRIRFNGTPGHGSMPFGADNALLKASKAADRLNDYCDNKIPITTEYLSNLVEGIGLGTFQKFLVTNKILLPFALRRMRKIKPQMGKTMHSLTRMTISPNIIEVKEPKVNVIPATVYLSCDIRTLPRQDEDYVINHLNRGMGDLADEAIIETVSAEEGGVTSYGNASPARGEFVDLMEKIVQKEVSEAKLVPFIMPAISDSRFLREKGVNTYGFSLFDPETPMEHLSSLAHGTNERISIKTLELSTRVYYNLAKEFNNLNS